MLKFKEYSTIYAIGAAVYGFIEIFWRGFTHWTMVLTGGTCFLLTYIFNKKHKNIGGIMRCFAGGSIITVLEFIVGCIVNRKLKWNVWDYSKQPFNFKGQICLIFSVLWFMISIPMIFLCNKLEPKFSKTKKGVIFS